MVVFCSSRAKFVRDFKSLANEADESLAKHKALEFEIERLLQAVISQDIMSIVQNPTVVKSSDLQTELERTKERFENSIIKKENEYAKLWNDWYKKYEECKYEKILYDKAYNDMQQKIERLQAQLGDLKGKCKDTPAQFGDLMYLQQNYSAQYKNPFDSISVTRTQTKSIIDYLQDKLHNTVKENAKLRAQLFDKASEQKDATKDNQMHLNQNDQNSQRIGFLKRIDHHKTSREDKFVPINKVRASVRTNPITVSQPHVVPKKDVNSNLNGSSSTRVDNTSKTRRPQPRSNTKNDRVPSVSKSRCFKNNEVEVEEHHRNLLLSKNRKHMSSECNNVKLVIRNDNSEVVCAICKQCLINANHDVCALKYVNGMNFRRKNRKANVSIIENQKKQTPQVWKPKKVGFKERLASPKPRKPRSYLRWSPTGRMFDRNGNIIESNNAECHLDYSNVENACSSNPHEPTRNWFPKSTFSLAGHSNLFMFLGTIRFGNDHVAAILGYGDLQWGNILITKVYFIEGLGYNLFSVGQFCDLDLEVAFRRNTYFVRNLEGAELLKGNHTINLYTINLHEIAYVSPICLISCATSTKSWLWHQRLSHLNFDTINDLARNDLVTGLLKFKYHKEHLCLSCEQGKSKRASHPPKPVPNSKQRLHLLHMDLYGPMRIASINGKRYVLVIVDDYSRYTWVHFLRSKDEAPEVIKTFLKKIQVLFQAPVIVNDRKDIGKLGVKGDIGFFIGYSANSCAYRVYNRRTKKIIETMNVTFDELLAMAFEQSNSKPWLQGMTFVQISSGLDLNYASSTTTTQQPTEGELDLLFEAMHDDYFGGQPSAALRTILAAQAP
ncbi:integrase, catalytic region, zinc finger, CCHC-type containing protein [Tanacetum coccineum]